MARIERDGVTYVWADGTGGYQTISDILQNFGTFYAEIDPPPAGDIDGRIVLSGLYSDNFEFEININQGRFNFIRNGHFASLLLPRGSRNRFHFFARWDPEAINVMVLEHGYGKLPETERAPIESFQSETATPFTTITSQLILWAREQNYLPAARLASEDEFFAKFVEVIGQVQERIEATGSQRAFWDFKQENGVPPIPKTEPQVTSTIHLLLDDAAVRNNFQIIPQAGAAGGNLDFQVNGTVEGGKLAVLAMEAKHAHSNDIEHGLFIQLPIYMRAVSADFGIYLVLWFKGKDFDKPAEVNFEQLQLKFILKRPRPPSNVRIMHLDLSIPAPPSKR